MKKKVIICLCIILVIGSMGMGSKFVRRRVHGYYKRHFSYVDYIFRDKHIFTNAMAVIRDGEERKNQWKEYFNKSLKINSKKYLTAQTAYFSKQGNHPDMLYFKDGLNGYKYWMAFTPYPYSKDKYENPHILAGNSENKLEVPRGLKNPIVPEPKDFREGGHLSDTDISYKDGKFLVHYVYNRKGIPGPSKFFRVESKDGIAWESPRLVYESRETVEGYSPAIIYETGKCKMWYVGGEDNLVVTESSDDENIWSKIQKCNIKLEDWRVWHLDIIKTEKKYEGLVCARSNSLKTRALFYMDSADGINWRTSKYPIIFPDKRGWDNSEIYRATFIKENGEYKIWYSARNGEKKWYIGYTSVNEDIINNLEMN